MVDLKFISWCWIYCVSKNLKNFIWIIRLKSDELFAKTTQEFRKKFIFLIWFCIMKVDCCYFVRSELPNLFDFT